MIRPQRVALGMTLALIAYSLFTVHDAAVKWLVVSITIWQILVVRSAIIVLGCLAMGGWPLLRDMARSPQKPAMLLRGSLLLCAWFCYFTGGRVLPLGQMQTLYFTAPLIVTLAAVPMLGEKITLARGAAVAIGFVGVVLASDVRGLPALWPALLVLVAAALWGIGVILMRRIARRERSLLQILFVNLFFLCVTSVGAALTWRPMDAGQTALLCGIGLVGLLAQFCVFEAARHASASVTATLEYSSLVLGFVLGYAIWGDVPGLVVFLGAGLITAAGTLLVFAERAAVRRSAGP